MSTTLEDDLITTTPTPPESPHNRGWHYRAAEKLLVQCEQITVDYAELPEHITTLNQAARLAALHEMLSSRANTHALLASVKNDAYEQANDSWAHEYRAVTDQ